MEDDLYAEAADLHLKKHGKLETHSKFHVHNRHDLSLIYTPGVAEICRRIARDPDLAYAYSMKANTVAIATDGSAVLGLGNIGPYAAIPVMEGKAVLFKEFAGIDAVPLCIDAHGNEFIETVRRIAPAFGGINLEDIAAPRCFEIEEALQDLGIPVMHDDQHGTAVVVLAAVINACRVTGRSLEDVTIVVSGAGAAGTAITRLLKCVGMDRDRCTMVGDVIVCDRKGILYRGRPDLLGNPHKYILAHETNRENRSGTLADALAGADILIGVSAPGLVTPEMVGTMKENPIILALANPEPEILPDAARSGGAAVVGTGRSDLPNQCNNVLAFPGIFRGALDAHSARITDGMKIAAAHALADAVHAPNRGRILPSVLNREVAGKVAAAVREAALREGVGRVISPGPEGADGTPLRDEPPPG